MSTDNKKTIVHPGDLLAAVRAVYGPEAHVVDFEVSQGTETVQGFASLMLRVKVTVQESNKNRRVNFIIKRKPVVAAHAAMIDAIGDLVDREATFFNTLLPILLERCPDLPIVKGLVCHKDALVMEDLCDKGFKTMAKNFNDMIRGVLTFPMARMCFRQLARLHAASLGTDWRQVAPLGYFAQDILLEGNAGPFFRSHLMGNIAAVIIPLLRKIKPDLPDLERYVDYLKSPDLFENVMPFLKYDESNGPNVLLHADCHFNNTMFKMGEDQKPLDMRFIDFQILRNGPPYSDLVNFLYTGTSQSFKDQHEKDLIRAYVEAFNAAANETPDLLDFDKFYAAYDKARYFGVVIAIGLRPMMLLPQPGAETGGEITEEFMEAMKNADLSASAMMAFENDPFYRKELTELIEHSVEVFKRYVFPSKRNQGRLKMKSHSILCLL